MPTVISYDSPAIMAGLAGDVSDARGNQQQFEDQLQADHLAMQQQQARAQFIEGLMQPHGGGGMGSVSYNPQVVSPAYTSGGGGAGPTVYNPQGALGNVSPQLAANLAGGGAAGGGALAGGSGGTGHMPRNVQQAAGQLDAMHQNGLIDDTEYMRRKGILMSGGDPFSEPTSQERQRDLQLKSQTETAAQQGMEQQRQRDEEGKRSKEVYTTRMQSYSDQIKEINEELKAPTIADDRKQQLINQKERLNQERRTWQQQYENHLKGQGQGGGDNGSAPKNARPLPRTLMQQFIRAAGYNPELAKQLAAAKGFNPDQVVDDRPDQGIQIMPQQPGPPPAPQQMPQQPGQQPIAQTL